ncbi:MAG: TIM barrel protein [Lachnospiraceae bacterium]|nr:TIM barrel protein [Lachnospiraceae bacterium]
MSKYLIIPDSDNIDELLKIASDNDLGFEFNDFFNPGILDDKVRCDNLISKYSGYVLPGLLTSHGAFFDVTVFSDDGCIADISKKRIIRSMEIAGQIGAGAVVFHTNLNPFITTEKYLNNWLDRNEEFFSEVCARYPDITVLLENMFDNSPKMLATLALRLKDISNFGVCLDYAHAFISGESLKEWAETLSPYIKHVHINDNDGRNDLHAALGSGRIDWEEFCFLRRRYFPDATVLIETTDIADIKASLEFIKTSGFDFH